MSETTVLVPGFNDDERMVAPLARSLERAGFATLCVAPQPSNGDAPIELLAKQLAAAIDNQLPPEQPLNLVGFSMGGLVCRVYIQQLGGLARTRRLITLATPHQGTYMAYVCERPACVQMRPGSSFLTELNRDLSALHHLQFTSLWTPFDLTIVPAMSSVLDVGNARAVFSPFHATLPLDPRIPGLITTALRRPLSGAGEKTALPQGPEEQPMRRQRSLLRQSGQPHHQR